MAKWKDLHPIFEGCAHEKGFEGGGRQRIPWWRHEDLEEVLRETLVDASQKACLRRGHKNTYGSTADSRGME